MPGLTLQQEYILLAHLILQVLEEVKQVQLHSGDFQSLRSLYARLNGLRSHQAHLQARISAVSQHGN
ncbi:unnamed protein product, partial [Figwort mosaic virus]